MREVTPATADRSVNGSSRFKKWGAESGVMYGLSTMNTKSNLAASARRAPSLYQSMLMLALLGTPGCFQPSCVMPTPCRIAPSRSCLFDILSTPELIVRNECGAASASHGAGRVALGDELVHQRQQVSPIADGVFERFETANQEVIDAEVVVVEECLGHLLGRPD